MQTHQERVVTEKSELDSKVEKLDSFVYGDVFPKLEIEERMRLLRQFKCMKEYSAILGERIAAFGKENK